MPIHEVPNSDSRPELQNSQNGSALKEFDILNHLPSISFGARPDQNGSGSVIQNTILLGAVASTYAAPTARLKSNALSPIVPLPLQFEYASELLHALGETSGTFDKFPKDGLAIVSHWLRTLESVPIGLGRDTRKYWLKFLSILLHKKHICNGKFLDFSKIPFGPISRPKFRFIDLCAGIGGFRIGLQALGGKCVFACEIDKYAKETYRRNFGEVPFDDLRRFTRYLRSDESIEKLIPDHDILAAGFPCQPFSPAGISYRSSCGKQTGTRCHSQGQLIFDILRIIEAKRPEAIFLENVTNFKTLQEGKPFKQLKQCIEHDLGYSFHSAILDSSSLVPQRRKRLYIVCFKKKRRFSFPSFDGTNLPLSSILESTVNDEYTISDKLWKGHIARSKRNLERGSHFTAFEVALDKPSPTLVARYGKDGKECLVPQKGCNPRFLTPRECARLQGFPDRFLLPEYDSRAYRQFGNAVVVPVVEEIGRAILKRL